MSDRDPITAVLLKQTEAFQQLTQAITGMSARIDKVIDLEKRMERHSTRLHAIEKHNQTQDLETTAFRSQMSLISRLAWFAVATAISSIGAIVVRLLFV